VLLLFGARRVPEIGASIGKGIREFKRSINDVDRAIREPEPLPQDRLPPPSLDPAARRAEDESRPEPKRLLN
jgi:TatA/E family protein of Tat protein translocase